MRERCLRRLREDLWVLNNVWNDRQLFVCAKIKLFDSNVKSVFVYDYEHET